MSKKQKKSKIKLILAVVLIVIFILIIVLSILLRKPTSLKLAIQKLEYINSSNVEQWEEGTFYPDGSAALGRAYEGKLSIMNIGKSMYYVSTDVLPRYYKKLKDASKDKIIKYYKREAETIYTELAIEKQDKFVELVQSLQKLKGDELKLDSYRIDLDSVKKGGSYTKAVLYIKYSKNEEIGLNVKISNIISPNHSSLEYIIK